MLQLIKNHPAESLAVALALFNLMAKVASKIANKDPEASRVLSFISALGPDLIDAALSLVKKPVAPDAAVTVKELPK